MSPSRRTLLRTVGVGLSAALGGCLSSSGGSPTTETTQTTESTTTIATTDTTTTATAPPEVNEVAPADIDRGVPTGPNMGVTWNSPPFRAFAVGESPENVTDDRPHHVWVWNATEETRTIEFALTTDGGTLFEQSTSFEPGTALAVVLREPRKYELSVTAGELEGTVTVERSRFDCNESATDVVVSANQVKTGTVSQSMACSTTTAGGA